MRRMLLAFLVSFVPLVLSAPAAHADGADKTPPRLPQCVYAEVTIPEIGHSPMVTVCRP